MKPTILGTAICEYLAVAFPDIFDLQFTAQMEDRLDAIAQGDLQLLQTLKDFYTPFAKEVKEQQKATGQIEVAEDKLEEKCPQCSSDLVARYGKYGKFYACKAFPKCRYIKPNLHVVKNHKCPQCDGDLVVRYSKKGKRFYGCANYPKCTHVQWALNIEPKG
jgi:DNA topoisomerase I